MTVRALAGLVVYNAFLLGVGAGLLWGVRGWRWWTDFVRLSGVAYLLGVSALMVVLTVELVLGVPVGAAAIVLSGAVLAAAGVLAGRRRGHVRPALRPPGWRIPGISLVAALFLAGIVVYLEALFRADRLAGIVREWDSWAFWMPRAKGVYLFERLEPEFLLLLPQRPSYPPGISAVQAGAFHAMGSADTVSLHVQYWFFAVAFVAAVSGLLWRRVHHAVLFPVLLLFLVAPSLVERITTVYADVPLGYLTAIAALLVVLWVDDRKPWQLVTATVLLAGAMLTKREGLLFAACVFLAGFVASWTQRRRLWPRLFAAGVAAVALTLPWRIWFTAHGLETDGPESGYLGAFEHLDRVWPSLELTVTVLYNRDLWRIAPYVAAAAILAALAAKAWRVSLFAATFLAAAVAGATWAIWSNTSLRIIQDDAGNPIVRITGTTILTLAVLTPLLLERAWWGPRRPEPAGSRAPVREAILWRTRAAWLVVLVGLLSHPGAMLVGYSGSGLPGGAPRFLGADDCILPPRDGQGVRVVVGYAESYPEANALRDRAVAAGLARTEVAKDGCGRLRVFVDDLGPADAPGLVADGEAAGLEPRLEGDPDG